MDNLIKLIDGVYTVSIHELIVSLISLVGCGVLWVYIHRLYKNERTIRNMMDEYYSDTALSVENISETLKNFDIRLAELLNREQTNITREQLNALLHITLVKFTYIVMCKVDHLSKLYQLQLDARQVEDELNNHIENEYVVLDNQLTHFTYNHRNVARMVESFGSLTDKVYVECVDFLMNSQNSQINVLKEKLSAIVDQYINNFINQLKKEEQ
jgi:hypothetical protein